LLNYAMSLKRSDDVRLTTDKDVNAVLSELFASGWRYTDSGKHIKLFSPQVSSGFIVISKTPSDYRAVRNIRQTIRRMVAV
jgi:hypothetical protein